MPFNFTLYSKTFCVPNDLRSGRNVIFFLLIPQTLNILEKENILSIYLWVEF